MGPAGEDADAGSWAGAPFIRRLNFTWNKGVRYTHKHTNKLKAETVCLVLSLFQDEGSGHKKQTKQLCFSSISLCSEYLKYRSLPRSSPIHN